MEMPLFYHRYSVSTESDRHFIIKRIKITSSTACTLHLKNQSYDRQLRRTLREIFHERGALTSIQIKKFLRTTDNNSIIKLILEKRPKLSEIFPKVLPTGAMSLLWIVVLEYLQKSAEMLVRLGADVNVRYNTTILHMLLTSYPSSWNDRMINLVINHDADLQTQDWNEDTPLHCAVYASRVQIIKLLLEKGADINATNKKGLTPLLIAICAAKTEKLLPLLIEHGADVTHSDAKGGNALHYLAQKSPSVKQADLARLLIEKGTSLNDRTRSSEFQPIHYAVNNWQNNELVNLFLDHGVDVNAQGKDGQFLLYIAAARQNASAMLLTLLKRGANIDQKTRRGHTALHMACEKLIMENIKTLLSAGADILVEASNGKTPLAIVSNKDRKYINFSKHILMMLALKKVTCPQPSIEWEDEKMIEQDYPELWDYYQVCIAEAKKAKLTRFLESFTFLEFLTKCQCQIADLMRNPEFSTSFCLYDLQALFPVYKREVTKSFERTENYHYSILQQENVIDEAVYNTLPHMVVRKMARYVVNCEVCEMKRIVHASRQSAQQEQ